MKLCLCTQYIKCRYFSFICLVLLSRNGNIIIESFPAGDAWVCYRISITHVLIIRNENIHGIGFLNNSMVLPHFLHLGTQTKSNSSALKVALLFFWFSILWWMDGLLPYCVGFSCNVLCTLSSFVLYYLTFVFPEANCTVTKFTTSLEHSNLLVTLNRKSPCSFSALLSWGLRNPF